jgi:hypothetical protein
MIEKGPDWLHSLRLIEFFPDLTNFILRELRNINFFKVVPLFFPRLYVCMLVFDIVRLTVESPVVEEDADVLKDGEGPRSKIARHDMRHLEDGCHG